MTPVKTYLAPFSLAIALTFAGASVADAGWSRSGGGTGPRGNTWNSSGFGSCSDGSCSHSTTVTGPNGEGYTRSGTVTRY